MLIRVPPLKVSVNQATANPVLSMYLKCPRMHKGIKNINPREQDLSPLSNNTYTDEFWHSPQYKSESTYYLISQFYVTFAIKLDNVCSLSVFLYYGVT